MRASLNALPQLRRGRIHEPHREQASAPPNLGLKANSCLARAGNAALADVQGGKHARPQTSSHKTFTAPYSLASAKRVRVLMQAMNMTLLAYSRSDIRLPASLI